jgi:hypothetical protein
MCLFTAKGRQVWTDKKNPALPEKMRIQCLISAINHHYTTHIRKWSRNAKHIGHIATPSLASSVSSPNQSLSSAYVLLAEIADEFT